MTDLATHLAQLGNSKDKETGSISPAIHLSTTYAHPGLGESTGYDYTRTKNPTREILEEGLAKLENGTHGIATSSGMSAIQLVFQLFKPNAKYLVSQDLYGGSFRYFDYLEKHGATFNYFSTEEELEERITAQTDAVFVETPTNPLMQTVDLKRISKTTKANGSLLIVDNTLMTPLRQKPLVEGAQIVVHSATKFLTGHNDILAGAVITNDSELGEQLSWLANTTGPTLSSFDSWLFIRSLKTLPIRFNRQEKTTKQLVQALETFGGITDILYAGEGAMVSIRLTEKEKIGQFLDALNIFTFAESLGGVESLITYPTTQTHFDIPQEIRESYGLTSDLLRLSIGLEDPNDLIQDIQQALEVIN